MNGSYCLLAIFYSIYVFQGLFDLCLDWLNISFVKRFGTKTPRGFEGVVDPTKLTQISSYTIARGRLGAIRSLQSDFILLGLILSGFMKSMEALLGGWRLNDFSAGILFFLTPVCILNAADLPFDYYHSFVVEEKFGFNRSTVKIWLKDHSKSAILSLAIMAILWALIFCVMEFSPYHWWFWGFIAVSGVQIAIALFYPVLIAPIFNTFQPIRDQDLAAKVTALMEENGLKVKKVLEMNAGLRSRHTNAYFTGLGKTKQIVLYDTLIESHSHEEILSVLAHEVGHLKHGHVVKQLIFFEAFMLLGFYLSYRLMELPLIYSAFGSGQPKTYVGLFFTGIIWQKTGFFLYPLYMALSRHFERQADLFAAKLLGSAQPLMGALRKMASDNLSNLRPHPLFVWFHYSHPPLVDRIDLLEEENLILASANASRQNQLEAS